MLTVHHLRMSQSERIVWLCEELQIPYELKVYDRDPQTQLAPAAYKALHPMGIAPVITDGSLVLGESAAIVDYIVDKYGEGRLRPAPGDANYADYLYWFHAANGTLMAGETNLMISAMLLGEQSPTELQQYLLKALAQRLSQAYALMNQQLADRDYLAGPALSAADIMNVFGLTTLRLFVNRSLDQYPNIQAYLTRVRERPGYQRAMDKAAPK